MRQLSSPGSKIRAERLVSSDAASSSVGGNIDKELASLLDDELRASVTCFKTREAIDLNEIESHTCA